MHGTNVPEQAVSYRNHSSTAKPIKPRYQTVKVGAPPGTGQTCSCMDLVLMEFGFSLRGIHCRNSLYIFNSPLPVCVALCLPEQLATAGVSRMMDTYVQSWVSQRPSEQPWSSYVTFAFPVCRTAWVVLVFVTLCIPEGLFHNFSERVTSVVAEAIGKRSWAGVILHVGHWVQSSWKLQSSEQCLLRAATLRWDELLVIRLLWGLWMPGHFQLPLTFSVS